MEHTIKSYAKPVLIGFSIFIVLLVSLGIFVQPPKAFSLEKTVGGVESYYGSPQSYSAGCGTIFRAKNAVAESKQIPESYYLDIPNDGYVPSSPLIVPTYGYLTERGMHPSQFKFYSEESVNKDLPEQLILRTMWDSGIPVIWYDPKKISPEDYATLEGLGKNNEGRLLILPWLHYDSANLPRDRAIAYSVFGMSQTCKTFNRDALNQFLDFADKHPFENKPVKPEIAKLSLPELL